jgi:predicted amino acid racemase
LRIEVDCERIRHNAKVIVAMCAAQNIQVAGVTKACCGHPEVGRAMLAGGVRWLADSRVINLRRMRDAGIDADMMLLRLPLLSEAHQVVRLAQLSLNSQVDTVRALSDAAQTYGVTHQVILMVETGDRREGVMPEDARDAAQAMLALPGIELVGIGTNVGCIGGVLPTRENSQMLVDIAEDVEQALGIRFKIISGGYTAHLALVDRHELPARINQLRIGEAIILGVNSQAGWPLACPHQDAFNVVAEVVEVGVKPSKPEGIIALDAFGREPPEWEEMGPRRRALVAMGEQDMRIFAVDPKRPGVTIVGASSDYLLVDVTGADPPVQLGDVLEFNPRYAAVTTAMASRGVQQVVKPIVD